MNNDKKLDLRDDLWMIWPMSFGLGWVEFFIMGKRAKKQEWTLFGALYLSIWLTLFAALVIGLDDDGWMGDAFLIALMLQWIPQLIHLWLCRKEYRARRTSTHGQNALPEEEGVIGAAEPPAKVKGSAWLLPIKLLNIISIVVLLLGTYIVAAFVLLAALLNLNFTVDYFQGKAHMEVGDYASAWREMDNASNIVPSAAAYREYCSGMQLYALGDYEMAESAFVNAGDILDASQMAEKCTVLRAEASDEADEAWRLAGGDPGAVEEDRLWINPELYVDEAGVAYHDYLFIAAPGSTIRTNNATGELLSDSTTIPDNGGVILRIADEVFYPNRPLTEQNYVAAPSFSVTRPDGSAYAVLCEPFITRFPELEITASSLWQYWDLKSGDTIHIEGNVNSEYATLEVNGTAIPVYEGGAFVYRATLTEADVERMQDGKGRLSFIITAQQDNHVSAEMQVMIEATGAKRSTQGEGWRYEDGTLTISSDQGMDNFYQVFNAPTEFDRIVFEEGVTSIDLLGKAYYGNGVSAHEIAAKEVVVPATAIHIRKSCYYDFGPTVQRILISKNNPAYYKENGMLIEKRTQTVLYADCDLEEAIVPEGVRAISANAFYRRDRLTKATLPDGLRAIGPLAFYDCEKLAQINLPNSLNAIFDSTFGSTQLRTLVFPPKVQFYLLSVSESEGAANASLLEWDERLNTIVFTDSASFNVDALCLHAWPKDGNGRLILIGPPPDIDIVKNSMLYDNENKYAICYLSAYADEWKGLDGVYEDGCKTIRQLSAKEEADVLAFCADAMAEQPGKTAAEDALGWRFVYEFNPEDARDEEWPDHALKTAFHMESDEGLRNFQDGLSLGYAQLYGRFSLVLEDGVTAFVPDPNANQPVNDLYSLTISKTVAHIAPDSFSAESVEVAADSPYYYMHDGKLIETATGKIIWQAEPDGTDAPASTSAIPKETPKPQP